MSERTLDQSNYLQKGLILTGSLYGKYQSEGGQSRFAGKEEKKEKREKDGELSVKTFVRKGKCREHAKVVSTATDPDATKTRGPPADARHSGL